MSINIEKHDKQEIRCRMLGHTVPFSYCRKGDGSSGLPCRKIFDCWFAIFNIKEFISQHYSPEQIRRMMAPPQPKMSSLIELIQQAQKNNSSDEES